MIDLVGLVFALIAGMLLGAIFFGGLWWTVRKGAAAKHPALLFLGSMLLRTGFVVTGFYFILGNSWQKLLAGLLGFIIARQIVIRLTRHAEQTGKFAREAGHAP